MITLKIIYDQFIGILSHDQIINVGLVYDQYD